MNPSLSGGQDSSQVTKLPGSDKTMCLFLVSIILFHISTVSELKEVNQEQGQDGSTQAETEKEQTHFPEIHSGYQTKGNKLFLRLFYYFTASFS